ncbi:sister chromatid cohesion protein DCC1-like [Diadema antillarum]|uniref:sister chromatid cohesion protein DCC1-like n=1 Tax=Diadema antillarum TaxID=105358 RepID=UPI003A86EFA6
MGDLECERLFDLVYCFTCDVLPLTTTFLCTIDRTRTLEEVHKIAENAKLNLTDLAGQPQCLYFGHELNPASMRLLEVDDTILNCVEEGQRLVIRGNKTDHAVLCTDGKTYDLKVAETSNTLLLLEDCFTKDGLPEGENRIHQKLVTGVMHSYLEVRPLRPRLKKLQMLLQENPFAGNLYEDTPEHSGQRFTMAMLLDIVQASEKEILEELQALKACLIKDCWRVLDFDYESQAMTHILSLVQENSWSYDEVPVEETLATLESLEPRCIISHCLKCYGEEKQGPKGALCSLDTDKICQLFAEMLLRPADKFNLSEFLEVWQQSVPEGMVTTEQQLKGLALIDRSSSPAVTWYYPVSALPEDEKERFNMLFKTKEKWTLDEITPYIEGLATEKLSVGVLLQRNCRTSLNAGGVRMYNSKRPVK